MIQSENEPEVIRARKEMINHPKIQALLEDLKMARDSSKQPQECKPAFP